MKVIISGSRNYYQSDIFIKALFSCPFREQITEVVTGGARGIDETADNWAKFNNIDRTQMWANWNGREKSAGPSRNSRMSDYGDTLIAIPSTPLPSKGSGTWNMIKISFDKGYRHIHVYCPEDGSVKNREDLAEIFYE